MRESIGDPGLQSDMLPGALRDVAAGSGDAGRLAGSLAKEGRDEVGRGNREGGHGSMEAAKQERMSMNKGAMNFVVPGEPVGKGRPKFARRGNFVTAYTPEKTASYENLVKLHAHAAMVGRPLFDGPVAVEMHLFVTPPASWSKKKQLSAISGDLWPTSKPDIDNVAKGIFDACNNIVWGDDKQVVTLSATKCYGAKSCAVIGVTAL